MSWVNDMNERIKKSIRNWLNIQPGGVASINITEVADFEITAIRNRIWYRGDSNELEQLYQQSAEFADKYKFWGAKASPGMEIRKIHTGLPGLIVKVLVDIVMADMNDFDFQNGSQELLWQDIEKQNKFRKKIKRAIRDALYIGDGAWKLSMDSEVNALPVITWYPGDRIEIVNDGDEVKEIIFKTAYKHGGQSYTLNERYGKGYILNELYRGEELVELHAIPQTSKVVDAKFDDSTMLAVHFSFFDNAKFESRGGSIFDGKLDAFDALDETFSQWMDALRAGRSKSYIPDTLLPRNPDTGEIIKPNAFDNRYISTGSDMGEQAKNQIITEQPVIPHDSYLASYITALDLCLQGLISPSTLGIDTKKLDNSEAQREKEKTTLYTRNSIVDALQEVLPELVGACINCLNLVNKKPIEEVQVDIPFGEYANPSFESQVETVSKGKQSGIMSIEASVEELYGDTRDDEWKQEEIQRLKSEQGIQDMEEPGVNLSAGAFEIGGMQDGSSD